MTLFKDKLKESLKSVLPIALIVLTLSVTLVPISTGDMFLFLVGVLCLVLGMSLFTAGATGATVFHTKSINNERAEQAIGTTINRERDSLFFLTTLEYKTQIMEAVRDAAGLKTEGGAVIFSLPVDDLAGVGRFEDYVDGEENK